MRPFKVLLLIPPDYDYNFPPLGTPALCAFLRQKGIAAEQIDLNLRYRDFLSERLSGSSPDLKERRFLLKLVLKRFFLEKLKDRYYSHLLARDGHGLFPYLPYDNNTNSSFDFTERLLGSGYLWRYLKDEKENTFCQFYEENNFLEFLEEKDIRLLGISIISPSQVLASLTLGLLVKKRLPHLHVTIGGQWPTLYRQAILQRRELFRCFDSVIVFEGERPLYELALALKANQPISYIPNIILKDTSPALNQSYSEADLDDLPVPIFDGLLLDTYDGNQDGQRHLTYETSRGCYWSRCAYCVDLPLPKPSYRRKHPELVVDNIKELIRKYNVNHILLSDPGLSPRQMSGISQNLLAEDVKINWWCMARLDSGFNAEIFELAAQAGLRKINFGFESASDRVCKLLDKGNEKERSLRIIKDCAQAGIEVDLQTMLGLPYETFNDGLETVDFLISNKKFISQVTFNIYYLTPANFIYEEPFRYGIEYERAPGLDFRFFIPFKNIYGMNREAAYLLEKIYYSLRGKDNNLDLSLSPDRKFFLSKEVSEEWLEFNLNQESYKMSYLRHHVKDEYIVMENEEQKLWGLIKKGLSLKESCLAMGKNPGPESNSKFSEFVGEALSRGFLTKSG